MSEDHAGEVHETIPGYLDTSLSFDQRADDLISHMTLEEKVSQMVHASAAIERLGIPVYNWWNECIHGVARAGTATVFPQSIALGATWNTELIFRIASAISTEARAKYHEEINNGEPGKWYYGLTFWSPDINLVRDPRWGRAQETYGEDPYLMGRIGVAFVKGIQGDHPKYLKAAACAKHFAVHSGPEPLRHQFNAVIDQRDLRQTYLPHFEALVTEAKVEAVMGAYSAVNGHPCCAHPQLLKEILRDEWGFDGHVVSDCGAICDIYKHHKYVKTPEEAAAAGVNAGCDLNCGRTYAHINRAVKLGLISEQTVDRSVKRLMMTRMRLGMFDPPEMVPYSNISPNVINCPEHRTLAMEAARESIVLLKNEGNLLPLSKDLKRVAVIGPNANEIDVLMGNYEGTASRTVTHLEGIRNAVNSESEVLYVEGCEIIGQKDRGFSDAVAAANKSDAVIMVMGLSPRIESEEGNAPDSQGNGDRVEISLPGRQEELLKAICATGKPVVLVLLGGSSVAIPWASENVPAILMTWYGGQEAGTASAEVIFGDYNPAGRLPITFYRSLDQLPPFEDYRMAGRTYRYFQGEPLYPFGFGLSYTTFAYENLEIAKHEVTPGESIKVSATVTNTGQREGDEVVQVYLRDVEASVPHPIRAMIGFERIHLDAGKSKTVSFTIAAKQMDVFDDDGKRFSEPGEFEVSVGGGQPIDTTGREGYVAGTFELTV